MLSNIGIVIRPFSGMVAPMLLTLYPRVYPEFPRGPRINLCIHEAYAVQYLLVQIKSDSLCKFPLHYIQILRNNSMKESTWSRPILKSLLWLLVRYSADYYVVTGTSPRFHSGGIEMLGCPKITTNDETNKQTNDETNKQTNTIVEFSSIWIWI